MSGSIDPWTQWAQAGDGPPPMAMDPNAGASPMPGGVPDPSMIKKGLAILQSLSGNAAAGQGAEAAGAPNVLDPDKQIAMQKQMEAANLLKQQPDASAQTAATGPQTPAEALGAQRAAAGPMAAALGAAGDPNGPLPTPPIPPSQAPIGAALGAPAVPPPGPQAPVAAALAAAAPKPPPVAPPVAPPGAPVAAGLPPPTLAAGTAPAAPVAASAPAAKAAAFSAPYVKGQGYYDLVHAGEGNGVNPITHAAGPVQVIPSTANAFHASPGNSDVDLNTEAGAQRFTQWYGDQNSSLIQSITGRPATNAEVVAAHLVGPGGIKALLTNPNAPIGQTLGMAAVKNNPGPLPDPNMTGEQALQSITNYYAGAKGGGSGGGGGVLTASSTSTPVPPPGPASMGLYQQQPLPFDPKELGKSQMGTMGLLALASGILGGKSFGHGLSKGLENMVAVGADDRKTQMAANSQVQALNQLGITNDYHKVLLQQGQAKVDNAIVRTGQNGERIAQNDPGVKQGMTDARLAYSNNLGSIKTSDTQANAARETLKTLDQYNLNGVAAGPDFVSRGKRALGTMLGIDLGSNPAQQQITEALDNSMQRGTLQNLGIGRILQSELPMLKGQVGGLAQNNPEAIKAIHDTIRRAAQARVDAQQSFGDLAPDEKANIMHTPGGYDLWLQNSMDSAYQRLKATPAQAPTAGGPAAPAGGAPGWSKTPGGFSYRIVS